MMTHDRLRLEYERTKRSMGTRSTFCMRPISIYRDIFSPSKIPGLAKNANNVLSPDATLRQYLFRSFINKSEQRREEDLEEFELVDLQFQLSMLLDITANLYRTRAQLYAELSALAGRCASDPRWISVQPRQRRAELVLASIPHLDKQHTWYLRTPIEWKEMHAAYKYPEHIDATRYDMASAKSFLILCAEDREFLIWHVEEMQNIIDILKDDMAKLG